MNFQKPGPNKRVCAFIIDAFIIQLIVQFFLIIGMMFGAKIFLMSTFLSLFLSFGLTLIRDSLNHQSIGKKIVGLTIIPSSGQDISTQQTDLNSPSIGMENSEFKLTIIESIKRNVVFIIPLISHIVEYFKLRSDPQGLRFGDQIAGTKVHDLKPEENDQKYLFISIGIVVGYKIFERYVLTPMILKLAFGL